jgi:transcriptional pleiotropic regulator of transition state genes
MKSTGIVRRVDELGRVVLPSEMRQTLDIQMKDRIEIFLEGDRIVLQKYRPSCIFCEGDENVVFFKDKRICADCLSKIKTQL